MSLLNLTLDTAALTQMEHVSYIASSLCINDTLQTLLLDNSPFGVKGATAFAEMLWLNHSLVELKHKPMQH